MDIRIGTKNVSLDTQDRYLRSHFLDGPQTARIGIYGTRSESCPMVGFGISGNEPLGPVISVSLYTHKKKRK